MVTDGVIEGWQEWLLFGSAVAALLVTAVLIVSMFLPRR